MFVTVRLHNFMILRYILVNSEEYMG